MFVLKLLRFFTRLYGEEKGRQFQNKHSTGLCRIVLIYIVFALEGKAKSLFSAAKFDFLESSRPLEWEYFV